MGVSELRRVVALALRPEPERGEREGTRWTRIEDAARRVGSVP